MSIVSNDRIYSSFSGLPKVLLALLLVLRFPGENATELPAAKRKKDRCLNRNWGENNFYPGITAFANSTTLCESVGKSTKSPFKNGMFKYRVSTKGS